MNNDDDIIVIYIYFCYFTKQKHTSPNKDMYSFVSFDFNFKS